MNEFVARNGLIALDNSTVTGSLNVTNGITGSLLGTSSWAVSASNAISAAWAPGGTSTAVGDRITTGSVTASVDVNGDTFRIISGSSTFLYVSSSGNVGVGVTNPRLRLDVAGNGTSRVLIGDAFGSSGYAGISLNSTASSTSYNFLSSPTDQSLYINRPTGKNIHFREANADHMVISASGNIGIGTTIPAAKLQVSGTVNVTNIRGSGSLATSSIFTVDGAAGRLFSVNDSLSGSLFSVNTIAGLPVIEAFSDNTVRIGQYGTRALYVSQSRVGFGKETSLNGDIDISGSAVVTGSLNISGSITSTGTITAQTLVVQTITSSVSWITGSSKFGNLITDTHQFTGSINVSGSITGTNGVINNLTASNATSASYALSASYAPPAAGGGYVLQASSFAVANFTWADATTYYIGSGHSLNISNAQGRGEIYIPKAGTITAVYAYASFSTAGSAESWQLFIVKNAVTSQSIETVGVSALTRDWFSTGISMSVSPGEYIEIKSNPVTWATNPVANAGYGFNATIYITEN